ncbi:MAG: N-acetylmuramic acid 6-phosphate etherase [Arenicella sp.]
MNTEKMPEDDLELETWRTEQVTRHIIASQKKALEAVSACSASISLAADAIVGCLQTTSHSRLVYAGAGSSGALLANDASELLPTYGWPLDRLLVLQAEGRNFCVNDNSADEDNRQRAVDLVAVHQLDGQDVVIVASASGATPYTLQLAESACEKGALIVAIVNNADSPLSKWSDHTVFLQTGAEVIAGSTRMAAGAALRATLCTLSTTIMIRLGRTYKGMMVDMLVGNDKLRLRAVNMVRKITGKTIVDAEQALQESGLNIKLAVLLLQNKVESIEQAQRLLVDNQGSLNKALSVVQTL